MKKLTSLLAILFRIPVSHIESNDDKEKETVTESTSPGNKLAWFDKKIMIIGVLAILFLLGTLWTSRMYHQRFNPVQVTPGDPNLYKTVKTNQAKSPSILASVEDELSNRNLNAEDTVREDVKLIAQRFSIKPNGQERHSKLVKEQVPDPVKKVESIPVPSPVIEPVRPSNRTTYINHRSNRGQKSKISAPVAVSSTTDKEDETFNTVRLSPSSNGNGSRTSGSESTKYIPAAIYGNQRIRSGSKARFRTTEAVTFQGVYIPKNTIISTVCFLGNNRLQFQAPAPMIAGQRLPVDLMCIDKDFSTGISYNYDVIDDNVRQVSGSTASNAASTASSVLAYGSPVAAIATDAVRGIANGVINGKRQKSVTQVEILDGYQVFFKSTK